MTYPFFLFLFTCPLEFTRRRRAACYPLSPILSCPQKSALVNPKNAKSLIHPLTTQIAPIVFAQKVLTSAQNLYTFVQNLLKTSALLLIFALSPFRR
jgi:hypothetical protein